jgi:hypothetical protein
MKLGRVLKTKNFLGVRARECLKKWKVFKKDKQSLFAWCWWVLGIHYFVILKKPQIKAENEHENSTYFILIRKV